MKVLITLGPTQEPIDPVRYITNPSSGKMGLAIVKEAVDRGHDITVVLGPVQISMPGEVKVYRVRTAQEMTNRVLNELKENYDIFICTAAIADYTPVKADSKIKSGKKELVLRLKPTRKLTRAAKEKFPDLFVVGFKAEHDAGGDELVRIAREKLTRENLDLIIANDVSRNRFGSDDNEVFIVDRDDAQHVQRNTKDAVSEKIWDSIENLI